MTWTTNPAHAVEYDASGEGSVGSRRMAKILDIKVESLRSMTRRGHIPCRLQDGVRVYDVRQVLQAALNRDLPIGLLKVSQGSYAEDSVWAYEALSRGPWNCPLAPSARAWRLYLEASEDSVSRRRLVGTFVNLGAQELYNGMGGTSADSVEQGEPDAKLTTGEIALQDLDNGILRGPFEESVGY